MSDQHIDLFRLDPLSNTRSSWFVGRYTIDGKRIDGDSIEQLGAQVLAGWATYYDVSEPHTMADCPHK
jgi:hypothetical protein